MNAKTRKFRLTVMADSRASAIALVCLTALSAFEQLQQNDLSKFNTLRYTIVDSLTTDGKDQFMSVVVRPGISDSELIAMAAELHRRRPNSHIDFYDKMDAAKIKQWGNCLQHIRNLGNLSCPEEWINNHNIGSLASMFDNPNHIWRAEMGFDGQGL